MVASRKRSRTGAGGYRRARKRVRTNALARIPRPLSSSLRRAIPSVSLKRTFWFEYWSFSTASIDGFWRFYQPTMATMPNLSEYTALFDQYKINGVKVTLRPRWTGADGSDATTAGTTNKPLQSVHYIVDPLSQVSRSGAYTSSTFNSFCENGNVKSVQGIKPIDIYWKPMHNEDAGGTSTARFVGPRYLSLKDATAVQQSGVHIFLQDPNFANAGAGWGYDVFFTFYFQLRGMK